MTKKDELQAQRNELSKHYDETFARIKELDEEIEAESEPEVTYSIGDRFLMPDDEKRILAQVGKHKCCLIGLKDGNRLHPPVKVNSCLRITMDEFSDISEDYEFERYWDNAKQTLVGPRAVDNAKPADEEAKSELRHGDYGLSQYSWIHLFGETYWTGTHMPRLSTTTCDDDYIAKTKLGNLADDIAARGESIDGFEMEQRKMPTIDVRIYDCGGVRIGDNSGWVTVEEDNLPKFILKLQQVLNGIRK